MTKELFIPFETRENWPSRSLGIPHNEEFQMCQETFLAHNNDLHYMNTCYANKSEGLSTMQKDLYKLGYILKETMLVFSHLRSV